MSDAIPIVPLTPAEDLQLTAFLQELHGTRPADDLTARILERAAAAPDRDAPRTRWLLPAAILLAGVGAVVAVCLQQGRPQGSRAAAPVAPPQEDASPTQDPPAPQDGKAAPDPALRARIARAIRDLENPERLASALAELSAAGAPALPFLEAALQAEAGRGRGDVAHALLEARARILLRQAKVTFGLPDVPLTLIADYSDNLVYAVDHQGKRVWERRNVFGAWDAELSPTGTMLVTQFSVSTLIEIDRDGKVVWTFENLKNSYDADRLANGNTLIADTFGGRVIEVNPAKEIVWDYHDGVRPFDCDRLMDGNTLIADVLGERVLEVTKDGAVAWELRDMKLVHDADRLANGNTLITLREAKKVIEVDRDGKVVFEIGDLSHPSDADRLPDGNTLVAEHGAMREFDRAGRQVRKWKSTWPVEAGRY